MPPAPSRLAAYLADPEISPAGLDLTAARLLRAFEVAHAGYTVAAPASRAAFVAAIELGILAALSAHAAEGGGDAGGAAR